MAQVMDVAKYFIQKDEDMTPLKLQKMCYYAQAWFGAFYGEKLFSNAIKAWDYGPVVSELYQEFKGSATIPQESYSLGDQIYIAFDHDELDILARVWDTYGDLDAYAIANKTHDEQPWKDTYSHKGKNSEIPFETMRSFYNGFITNNQESALEIACVSQNEEEEEEEIEEYMTDEETKEHFVMLQRLNNSSLKRHLELIES